MMDGIHGARDATWHRQKVSGIGAGNMESSVELYQNQVVAFAGAVRTGNQI